MGREIATSGIVGFDTESKPTFNAGEKSCGPLVVQFAIRDRAFIFQLHRPECRALVSELLQSAQILKVGFGLRNDRGQVRSPLGVDRGEERIHVEVANSSTLPEIRSVHHRRKGRPPASRTGVARHLFYNNDDFLRRASALLKTLRGRGDDAEVSYESIVAPDPTDYESHFYEQIQHRLLELRK